MWLGRCHGARASKRLGGASTSDGGLEDWYVTANGRGGSVKWVAAFHHFLLTSEVDFQVTRPPRPGSAASPVALRAPSAAADP